MNNYSIEEVLVSKDDPDYPNTRFRILKKGRRLVETPSEEKGESFTKYKWEDYSEFLMSSYQTERAAREMVSFKKTIDENRSALLILEHNYDKNKRIRGL